jgi:hypothetical protein
VHFTELHHLYDVTERMIKIKLQLLSFHSKHLFTKGEPQLLKVIEEYSFLLNISTTKVYTSGNIHFATFMPSVIAIFCNNCSVYITDYFTLDWRGALRNLCY